MSEMTRAAGKKQAKLQTEAEPILATCTGIQARLKSMGGKQVWSPSKLGTRHVAVASGEVSRFGKLLVALIPGEDNIWERLVLCTNDGLFTQCRHREFYLPSALWYEFPCGTDKRAKELEAAFEALYVEIDSAVAVRRRK
jgi:hypothetical protein